jgi:hypothetical protein
MKKIQIQIMLYTLTKNFMKVQRNMLNPFDTKLFYKMVGWFDGQNIGVGRTRSRFNPFHQHILCGVRIFVYIPYACV